MPVEEIASHPDLLQFALFHARDLVGANAVKNLIGFIVTIVALLMFVVFGQVDWVPGLIMAVGNLAGGYVGAKLAIRKGRKLIFALLIVVMVATGLKLIWPTSTPTADSSQARAVTPDAGTFDRPNRSR